MNRTRQQILGYIGGKRRAGWTYKRIADSLRVSVRQLYRFRKGKIKTISKKFRKAYKRKVRRYAVGYNLETENYVYKKKRFKVGKDQYICLRVKQLHTRKTGKDGQPLKIINKMRIGKTLVERGYPSIEGRLIDRIVINNTLIPYMNDYYETLDYWEWVWFSVYDVRGYKQETLKNYEDRKKKIRPFSNY